MLPIRDAFRNDPVAYLMRGIILVVTAIGLPVSGFIGEQLWSNMKSLNSGVALHTTQLVQINTLLQYHLMSLDDMLKDHEQRIRALERRKADVN